MIKILGHRGCAGLEPENTSRAFKKALDLGATAVVVGTDITGIDSKVTAYKLIIG